MRGKYSPTVTAAYMADQDWWDKFSATDTVGYVQFDPEGYDSYGYDKNDTDREGHQEHVYYESDEHDSNWRYNDALMNWRFDGVKPVRRTA